MYKDKKGSSSLTKRIKKYKNTFFNHISKQKWIVWLLFIILFIAPFILQINLFNIGTLLKNTVRIGKSENWLAFWGSYIGSVIAVLFAYVNTKIQLKESKRNDYEKAIKLNELNSAVSLLKASVYLENQVFMLSEEFKRNKDQTYYSKLKIDKLLKWEEHWNTYIEKYDNSIAVYSSRLPKDIIEKNFKLGKEYSEMMKKVNIDFSDEIKKSILTTKKISKSDKQIFSEAYPMSINFLAQCLQFTSIIEKFYTTQKDKIAQL